MENLEWSFENIILKHLKNNLLDFVIRNCYILLGIFQYNFYTMTQQYHHFKQLKNSWIKELLCKKVSSKPGFNELSSWPGKLTWNYYNFRPVVSRILLCNHTTPLPMPLFLIKIKYKEIIFLSLSNGFTDR